MKKVLLLLLLVITAFSFKIQAIEDGMSWKYGILDSGDIVETEQLPYDTTWYTITDYATSSIEYVVSSDTLHPADGAWDTVYVDLAKVGKVYIHVGLEDSSSTVYKDGIFVYANDTTGITPFNVQYEQSLEIEDIQGEIKRLIIWSACANYLVTIEQYKRENSKYIFHK